MKELEMKNLKFLQKDVKKLTHLLILFICCIIVVLQLSECFLKLWYPPIATHSRYHFNSTLSMPAITVCREPPYKPHVLEQYGLEVHPKYSIHWRNFPFSDKNLKELFEKSTYNVEENICQYAINKDKDHIEVTSSLHFNLGQCHTLRSKKPSTRYFKDNGISLLLQHTDFKLSRNFGASSLPGWHIFIHDSKENFTEIKTKVSGRIEYIFAEVEEEIEIKLQTQKFKMMENHGACSTEINYSAPKCGELTTWEKITKDVNCTAPFMFEIELPFCKNYSTMKKLIDNYMNIYDEELDCNCLNPCVSTLYSINVQNRKIFKQPFPRTQLWIYFTSKLVSIIEERPGYDLSQFISDLGGSLGFLLGLSVLGLIGILEKIIILIVANIRKRTKLNDEESIEKAKNQIQREEKFQKQNEFQFIIPTIFENQNKN